VVVDSFYAQNIDVMLKMLKHCRETAEN